MLRTFLVLKNLTNWPSLYFGFCFSLLSWRLEKTYFFIRFYRKGIGVDLIEECFLLLFCFVIIVLILTHLALLFWETDFIWRSLKCLFNIFAKIISPTDVFLDELLILLFSKRLAHNLFTKSDPSSASIKLRLRLDIFQLFVKMYPFFLNIFILQRKCPNNFSKFIENN